MIAIETHQSERRRSTLTLNAAAEPPAAIRRKVS
jgi:hypothetical protein